MKNIPLLIGTVVGTIILIVAVAFLFSRSAPATETTTVDTAQLVANATKIVGKDDAPVTVVEFSDFQCPSCLAAQPMVEQVLKQYPDTVKFVYRHFPLDQIHHNARLAAQASEVALTEQKFWEYHDLLFKHQSDWENITDKTQLLDTFAEYASQLKIDKKQFLEKIESAEVAKAVQTDQDLGNSIGVDATPTFFVNGKKTAAPQLLTVIEASLPAKK